MGMEIKKSLVVHAPADAVWAFLTDPYRVARCLPGAALTEKIDDATYAGTMTVKVGPVTASYRGKLRFDRLDAAAREADLSAYGQETRGKGGADMRMKSRIVERGPNGDRARAKYAAEENQLMASALTNFPVAASRETGESGKNDRVQIFLIGGIDDCTNSIQDEIGSLNELVLKRSPRIAAIRGFFTDEGRVEVANRFIANLSPRPLFPVSVKNILPKTREVTTPIVIVVRTRDGRVIDAHKPVPEDLVKRDAFYARLTAYLELI